MQNNIEKLVMFFIFFLYRYQDRQLLNLAIKLLIIMTTLWVGTAAGINSRVTASKIEIYACHVYLQIKKLRLWLINIEALNFLKVKRKFFVIHRNIVQRFFCCFGLFVIIIPFETGTKK